MDEPATEWEVLQQAADDVVEADADADPAAAGPLSPGGLDSDGELDSDDEPRSGSGSGGETHALLEQMRRAYESRRRGQLPAWGSPDPPP